MEPTPEQLAKLPQWARRHIEKLQSERQEALRLLCRFQDERTPSPVSYDVMGHLGTGHKGRGPTVLRRYIQSSRINITVGQNRNKDDIEVAIFHDATKNLLEIVLPRDFSYLQVAGPGTLHILPSPFDPFK